MLTRDQKWMTPVKNIKCASFVSPPSCYDRDLLKTNSATINLAMVTGYIDGITKFLRWQRLCAFHGWPWNSTDESERLSLRPYQAMVSGFGMFKGCLLEIYLTVQKGSVIFYQQLLVTLCFEFFTCCCRPLVVIFFYPSYISALTCVVSC